MEIVEIWQNLEKTQHTHYKRAENKNSSCLMVSGSKHWRSEVAIFEIFTAAEDD